MKKETRTAELIYNATPLPGRIERGTLFDK